MGLKRSWRAASTSPGMSKIGSDIIWAKSRAKARPVVADFDQIWNGGFHGKKY
jgi:hypothetical protein